ncbi:glycerophosphodiester phosphodiesterase [Rhizohabitans arisaemae]|uniref:glycerophosphodiester phosphodiesterase n=1 Tax=Rhizohabitans arisaemae TaxID=2720610 RepID=UPI0024B22ACB|nr:glycerophosphodiester phosphodiesterase family protein [Rhizohabitans arisaemae]
MVTAAMAAFSAPAVSGTAVVAEPASAIVNVAHRGASAYAPENTVAAFELASRQGADRFELDVRQTRDRELILMHDTTLARTTDVETVFPDRAPWRVADFTLDEIRRLDAGSWFADEFTGEAVPTLKDALRAMNGRRPGLLLEIKAPELHPGIEGRVAGELRDHPAWLRPGRTVVQSFDWTSMRTFHRLLPHVPVGLLGTPAVERLPELSRFARQINPHHASVTADYLRRVHDLGMEVHTWTVDDPEVMRRMISLGVDGVITNRPDLLRDLLAR